MKLVDLNITSRHLRFTDSDKRGEMGPLLINISGPPTEWFSSNMSHFCRLPPLPPFLPLFNISSQPALKYPSTHFPTPSGMWDCFYWPLCPRTGSLCLTLTRWANKGETEPAAEGKETPPLKWPAQSLCGSGSSGPFNGELWNGSDLNVDFN